MNNPLFHIWIVADYIHPNFKIRFLMRSTRIIIPSQFNKFICR